MKAAVYYETGRPASSSTRTCPTRTLPPSGVLVEVKAISIEGGDVLNRAGGAMTAKPHIVGYNCAGVVREVGRGGDGPQGRAAGRRRSMPFGSHAEVVVRAADARRSSCRRALAGARGVRAGPVGDGARLPVRVRPLSRRGRRCWCRRGRAASGIAGVQLAKRAGATVLATSSSDEKLERLKEYGMDHGINYREGVGSSRRRGRRRAGRGVNLVVDSVAGRRWRGACVHRLPRAGDHGGQRRAARRKGDRPRAAERHERSVTGVFFGLETFRSAAGAWCR